MAHGQFISFEGGEGAGKTTQITLFSAWLQSKGHEVVTTREPGGTKGAEHLRNFIKYGHEFDLSPKTETVLIYAARMDHVEKIIRPALSQGKIVLCDRFHDSTLAYQGGARGVDAEWIMKLHLHLMDDFFPDLTFFLSLPPEQGLKRAQNRLQDQEKSRDCAPKQADDRFENAGPEFHQRVAAYFEQLARLSPRRIVKIDADQSEPMVADQISSAFSNHMQSLEAD